MPLTRWMRIAVMAQIGLLVFFGCGGDDEDDESTRIPQATATSTTTVAPATPAAPTIVASPVNSPAAGSPVASPVTAAGAAASPVGVSVVLLDYRVNAFQTEFTVGESVTISIENNGSETHQFVIEPEGAINQPLQNGDQAAVVEGIEPGAIATLTWTFTEPGEYQFACHRDGHYDKGMVQDTIVVTP